MIVYTLCGSIPVCNDAMTGLSSRAVNLRATVLNGSRQGPVSRFFASGGVEKTNRASMVVGANPGPTLEGRLI